MASGRRTAGWLAATAILAGVELAGIFAIGLSIPGIAQAQFSRDERYSQTRRAPRSGGFFEQLFGGGNRVLPSDADRPAQSDFSRPPPAKKFETPPTLTVTVMGDSMADWLAYGLDEAFADASEIGIIRKTRTSSGLLRYEARSDLDWWHVARDLLAQDKTDYVVMMLGLNDRQNIRESQLQKEAEKAAKEKEAAKSVQAGQATADAEKKPDDDDDDEQPNIAAPERPRSVARGVVEFRSEKWEQIYTKRIDDTIAALKSRNVPVLWVGLPPIRGTRSTGEAGYLNDLFRARAERAGIVFIDVWDGFADEAGKFTTHGPDFEGQIRRLRSGDGTHFTKAGARKLAHYVERDLRRLMTNRALPVALPSSGALPDAAKGPAERPIAGPIVPLNALQTGPEELLGGGTTRPVHSDPTATRVLVKGEPAAVARGRADDFIWPRSGAAANIEPLSSAAAAARAVPPAPAEAQQPAKPEANKTAVKEPAKDAGNKNSGKKPQPQRQTPAQANTQSRAGVQPGAPRPPAQVQQQRKPQPQRRDGGPFGWLR